MEAITITPINGSKIGSVIAAEALLKGQMFYTKTENDILKAYILNADTTINSYPASVGYAIDDIAADDSGSVIFLLENVTV
ncbi:hypothetical protein LJC10_00435 [Selenomonadales bacterium OttesenSCG-928-I06]|nr:hypothetical protein [Selenomonadales bacterium OttesenSCG-928-I06]